jgi:hypothetical protein
MGGSIPWGFGVRFLYDAHLRFFRPGLPCALRVQNYVTPEDGFAELGFEFTPSGALQPEQTGFTDIPVNPPVEVWGGNTGGGRGSDKGMNQVRYQVLSRMFYISHTFVIAMMNRFGYSDAYQVWRDPSVIGLYYDSRLHSIDNISHEEVAGITLAWEIDTTYAERAVTVQGS